MPPLSALQGQHRFSSLMLKLIYEVPAVTDFQKQNSSVLSQLCTPTALFLLGPISSSRCPFLLPSFYYTQNLWLLLNHRRLQGKAGTDVRSDRPLHHSSI